jgi:hypothetical protein
MPANHNLNVPPYNDDWDPKKNFYRVMFKPGFPIQARELNQSQTILQDQIESLSSHFMKDGDNIVPGEFSLDTPHPYVRVSTITNGSDPQEYVGYNLIGVTSGVRARVILAVESTDDDDLTFYVTYEDSGNTNEYKTFLEQETLETDTPQAYTAKVGVSGISKPISTPPVGMGSLFTVSAGTYYVNGFMVRNEEQVITLDKYGSEPYYEVGFFVLEDFITSNEDTSLLDNAQGYSNFAAPGADRLQITLQLGKLEFNSVAPDFIHLATIQNGEILGKTDKSIKWDWLYDILAKRTFDESGDYIVTDFAIKPLEYHNSDEINGVFDADPDTGEYPPIPRSGSEVPLSFNAADALYAIRVDPGLAYVQGYECGYNNPIYVYGNKARNINFMPNIFTQITEGYNLTLTNVHGVPSLQNISQNATITAFDTLTLYRNFTDGYVGQSRVNPDDAGSRPLYYGKEPQMTVHIVADGEIGDLDGYLGMNNYNIIYNEGSTCVLTGVEETDFIRGQPIGNATIMIANVVRPRPSGVMHPRYFIPKQYVDQQDGYYGYNSTHKMGFISSVYYTELALVEDETADGLKYDWEVGRLVFGLESQSFATVEPGSTKDFLLVSNVIGGFLNGENIVQVLQGTTIKKISRLIKRNEVIDFQFYTGGTTSGDLGADTEIEVSAIGAKTTLEKDVHFTFDADFNKFVPTSEGRKKLYNFPYPEGSILNERVNYSLKTNVSGAEGYAITAPGKIANTLTKTKSIFSNLTTTNLDKFSADISIQNNVDAEVYDIADRSLFSGSAGQNFITCDNFSGDGSDELIANDVVTFVDDTGTSISKLVLFATKPVGYGEQRAQSIIYFTTALPDKVTGKTVQRIRVKSKGHEDQDLVFKLPVKTIASLQSDPITTRINYRVYRQFVESGIQGAISVTLSTDRDNERFVTDPTGVNIAIIRNTGGSSIDPVGRSIVVTNVVLNKDDNRQAEFELSQPLPTSCIIKILAPVQVIDAIAKQKLDKNTIIEIEPGFSDQLAEYAKIPNNSLLSLGIADVHKINKITMGAAPGEPGAVDVTLNYLLDDGQRDNYYDISRLYLKPGRPPAVDTIYVDCQYFEHSGDGDFFSVDSYTHDLGVPYQNIPTFVKGRNLPLQLSDKDGTVVELRDCVDFRPIVNTLSEGDNSKESKIATIVDGVSSFNSTNYRDTSNGGNGFVPRLPVPFTPFQSDLEYYLPRIDSLFLDKTGKMILLEGNSAISPQRPSDLTTAIRLYDLHLPAYTFSVEDITVKKYNYRRYTMADIASLDRKIDNIQQVVTLSILEQGALNMSVRDAVTGLDRFKNGIVVDSFANHEKGDVGTLPYRNSVDPKYSHLRAPHFTDQIELEEENQTDNQRKGSNYVYNNGIITVPYDQVTLAQNPFATGTVNLQPYSVFTYKGVLILNPEIDTFRDVNTLPDLVIEDNTVFDAMVNLTDEMRRSGMGTVWGDWETTGTSTSSATRSTQDGRATLNITETTESTRQVRTQTQTTFNVNTSSIQRTSYGDRVTDVQLSETMRSIPVEFVATRLKPNTRYYAFFDDIDVTAWCSIDEMSSDFPDGKKRYVLPPNRLRKGFGAPLLSDADGTLQGVLIIPNGRPPVEGTVFDGRMSSIRYQTSGPTRSFATGGRILRFSSSESNSLNEQDLEAYAEKVFTSSGVITDKQETIVSTRVPDVQFRTRQTDQQSRTLTSTGISDIDVDVRGPDVIERIETIERVIIRERAPVGLDPVAQTFMVDNTNPDGVFITELDAFFQTKDDVQGVEAYITTTDGGVPTRTILPHSHVSKNPDSILRVRCELPSGVDMSVLENGFELTGTESGATGVIKSNVKFESPAANPGANVQNKVYNVILSNYDGDFIAGEEVTSPNLIGIKARPTFTICNDEVEITRVDLTNMGTKYTEGTTVEFSIPELPGGRTATGYVKVAPINDNVTDPTMYVPGHDGQVYEIILTDPGSGYTRVPMVTIIGDGGNAEAECRTKKSTPGVKMGVSVSDDGTVATTFKFLAPVYLMGNTEYAFVLKSPNSLEYRSFVSKLGENLVGTNNRVTKQPTTGTLFKSQNGGLWTEDQTQDIKFSMRRADFTPNVSANIVLRNVPLRDKVLEPDSIETSSLDVLRGSRIFGINPRVLRVYQYNHGFSNGDYVSISGVTGNGGDETALGGIPVDEINTLHEVLDVDLHFFSIMVLTPATLTLKGGGSNVRCSYSRPYEVINVYTGMVVYSSSLVGVTNRATQTVGLSPISVDYEGNEVKYNQDNHYILDDIVPIRMMESYYYNEPMQVANYLNELKYNDGIHMRGEKSIETTIRMSSLDNKVSPVFDIQRTNMNLIRNLIDYPKPLTASLGATSKIITFKNEVDLEVGQQLTIDSVSTKVARVDGNKKSIMVYTEPGKKIRRNSTFSNDQLNQIGVMEVVNRQSQSFSPETEVVGSVFAKWTSKLFVFENMCDGIELKLSSIFYSPDSIRVYYRPRNIGFDADITSIPWIPFNPDQVLPDEDRRVTEDNEIIWPGDLDYSQTLPLYKTPGLPNSVDLIKPRSTDSVDPAMIKPDEWQSLTWSAQDLAKFDAISVKIVMVANNPALAPLIDDLQIVVSE